MAEIKNAQSENSKQEEKQEKKKKGVIIGVIGIAAAAAVAVPLALKGCAPGERSYTVTFLTDEDVEGFKQGSMNVKEGTTVGKLKDQLAPVDGYDFEGFYKDPDCTDPFDDDEVVSDDTKIYVAYQEKKYTLKFYNEGDALDGEPMATIDVYHYKTIKQSLEIDRLDTSMPKPKKNDGDYGYEFTGWIVFGNTEKVLHNKDFQTMRGKDILELDADGEAELMATFSTTKEKLYTVSFDETQVEVRKGNEPIKSGDSVLSGSRLTITSKIEFKDNFFMNVSVNGAELNIEDGLYHVTGNVSIATAIEHRYLEFKLMSDDTYEVKGLKSGATETDIAIPNNHYDGRAITSIAGGSETTGAFYGKTSLTSVTIGENIKTINRYAFYNCMGLTKIVWNAVSVKNFIGTSSGSNASSNHNYIFRNAGISGDGIELIFGDKVTSIPNYCFCPDTGTLGSAYYVPKIKSVTIGKKMESIGKYAFYGCNNIQSVNYLGSVNDWAGISFLSNYSNPCLYSKSLKINGELITEATLNVDINDYAFYSVQNLTQITLGVNVTSLGTYAFASCSGLKEITIPENITTLGTYAFNNCTALTKIQWNAISVGDFGENNRVFYNAGTSGDGIEVIFGEKVENIPSYCFYPYNRSYIPKIVSVIIGNSVTSIGYYAFMNCSSLQKLIIGNGLTSIENYAFQGCSDLRELTIGKNITSIGSYAFQGCSSLEELTIPEKVTSIGSYAFKDGSSLKELTIPEKVTSIESYAFGDCTALTKINWNAIRMTDFTGGATGTYGNANYIFYKAGQAGDGIEVIFGDKVTNIPAYCFSPDYRISYVAAAAPKIISVTISENITSIGDYAFYYNNSITKINWNAVNVTNYGSHVFHNAGKSEKGLNVIFSDSVQIIPASCLSGSGLTNVTIGENVTSIGAEAFSGCKFTEIIIPEKVSSIGKEAFWSCSYLAKIIWNAVKVSNFVNQNYTFAYAGSSGEGIEVIFGDGVQSIPDRCFYPDPMMTYSPNIISVVISKTVKSIGTSAFNNCSKIKTVYYGGTSSEWNSISGLSNSYITSYGVRYYYSEVEPAATGNYWHWVEVNGVLTPTVWKKD